ncbi:hypothetical protein LTR08_002741 [Meristemomyces frigidus]|nr:hypothetical protein LTR08_002741 [Meristemomyces frigidus]
MADPMQNQHALYDAQYKQINDLFMTEEDTDWPQISRLIDQALRDPFLPRWHRAEFEIIRSWDAGYLAEEHIRRAKEAIEDMRQVLLAHGRNEAHIKDRLAPLNDMVAVMENSLVDSD